jgi:hypothetical protein
VSPQQRLPQNNRAVQASVSSSAEQCDCQILAAMTSEMSGTFDVEYANTSVLQLT